MLLQGRYCFVRTLLAVTNSSSNCKGLIVVAVVVVPSVGVWGLLCVAAVVVLVIGIYI